MQHYNYDFFSGIDYTIDVRKPVGQRVTSIVFEGHELGEDEPVTVCINSYRFCGTGGYDMLPRQKVAREVLTDVADAMIDYITTHPEYPCGYPSVLHRDRLIVIQNMPVSSFRVGTHPNGCTHRRVEGGFLYGKNQGRSVWLRQDEPSTSCAICMSTARRSSARST